MCWSFYTPDQRLPRDYVVRKFYELGFYVSHNRANDTYNCCCPICREGKSFGKKRRCWYLPERDWIHCFNCGWSTPSIKWIMRVSGLSFGEISQELSENDYHVVNLDRTRDHLIESNVLPNNYNEGLPEDAINLTNQLQLNYYKDNGVVLRAIRYLTERRLLSAVNRPRAFYLSLDDPVHRNRIIIPFYDANGKIPFYQSRAFGGNVDGFMEQTRYLSKKGSERTVFGIDKVDVDIPYLFLFEGPIDSCFVRNGLGVAGINLSQGKDLTAKQVEQLSGFQFTHNSIWVLDSQWKDETAKRKTEILLSTGCCVFFWPKDIGTQYKDVNELCMSKGFDEIPYHYIVNHALCGEGDRMKFLMEINQ